MYAKDHLYDCTPQKTWIYGACVFENYMLDTQIYVKRFYIVTSNPHVPKYGNLISDNKSHVCRVALFQTGYSLFIIFLMVYQ